VKIASLTRRAANIMLPDIAFEKLTWHQFEELVAALIEAEGFQNVVSLGGSGGDMGLDISAQESRKSLAGRVSSFKWMIQAKHYAGSPKTKPRNVGHDEITDLLTFLSTHKADGFLLVTDTDLTASAATKLMAFNEDERHPFEADFWNRRMLADRLRKHPELVARYFGRGDPKLPTISSSANPFRFLESFSATEKDLFFGRDREVGELTGLVRNNGTLVVFGESGAGKTSLLKAGLLPQLTNEDFGTAYARCLETPCGSLRRAVMESLQNVLSPAEIVELASAASLAEFLRRLDVFVEHHHRRIVVVVDQFEESTSWGRAVCDDN
jgi:hypothetical protein